MSFMWCQPSFNFLIDEYEAMVRLGCAACKKVPGLQHWLHPSCSIVRLAHQQNFLSCSMMVQAGSVYKCSNSMPLLKLDWAHSTAQNTHDEHQPFCQALQLVYPLDLTPPKTASAKPTYLCWKPAIAKAQPMPWTQVILHVTCPSWNILMSAGWKHSSVHPKAWESKDSSDI